jgi:transcriptional regulator of arginine metabolism
MAKDTRQKKILSLIRARKIGTHQELLDHLERSGIPATQSSVSRDLEELGIVKHHGHYAEPSVVLGAANRGLISLETAGEILVVAKTHTGHASAVCVEIDDARIQEIIGTLAGEDTIFIAVADRKAQRAVIKKIWELFAK